MLSTPNYPFPKIKQLPISMPDDGSISMLLQDGVPVFRASSTVQDRIGALLDKQKAGQLSADEDQELDRYEEMDDYLSHLNRVIRNLIHEQK